MNALIPFVTAADLGNFAEALSEDFTPGEAAVLCDLPAELGVALLADLQTILGPQAV